MKPFTILAACILFFTFSSEAQLINTRQGQWEDSSLWNTGDIPTAYDDVVLQFDITITGNGTCRSLNANGHAVTIATGAHLEVTGTAADTLLKQFVLRDSAAAPGLDTMTVMTFMYDRLNRDSLMLMKEYSGGQLNYSWTLQSFYNGTERIPYRQQVNDGTVPVDVYYTHVDNKLVRMDLGNGDIVYNYTYLPDSIIRDSYIRLEDTTLYSREGYKIYYGITGNIIGQSELNGERFYAYEYDDHPNPFAHTSYTHVLVVYENPTLLYNILGKNNVLYQMQEDNSIGGYNLKTEYLYNAYGYPVIARQYDPDEPAVVTRAMYIYGH